MFGLTPFQLFILAATCAQNSCYTLLRRYSQGVLKDQALSSSILLLGEVIKLLFSLGFIIFKPTASGAPDVPISGRLIWLGKTSLLMMVPAGVYLAMNMLSFVSLQRIDAGLFTIIAQTKILTTAIFGVVMLRRNLAPRKWRALLVIVIGAILITNQSKPANLDLKAEAGAFEFTLGIVAVLVEVTLSGAISVYFEKVLKQETTTHTVWDRNIQLSFMSMIAYTPVAVMEGRGQNIFIGFSYITVLVSILGALGGILVALAMKYMDAIVKSLATSGSIVITTVLGSIYLSGAMDLTIALGSCAVIVAIFNYFDEGDVSPPQAQPAAAAVPLGATQRPLLSGVEVESDNNGRINDAHTSKVRT